MKWYIQSWTSCVTNVNKNAKGVESMIYFTHYTADCHTKKKESITKMTKRTRPVSFDYAQGLVKKYNDDNKSTYVLVCMFHSVDGDHTYKMETGQQCGIDVSDEYKLYCMDYGENGLYFFSKTTDYLVFSQEMTPVDLIEADCNIVYNSEQKQVQPVKIHPYDVNPEFKWKLIGSDGNEIVIGLKDWKVLSDYIDDLYRKKDDFLMWSFYSFINEHMCKECLNNCTECAIEDLKHMISRRIPDYDDFD